MTSLNKFFIESKYIYDNFEFDQFYMQYHGEIFDDDLLMSYPAIKTQLTKLDS